MPFFSVAWIELTQLALFKGRVYYISNLERKAFPCETKESRCLNLNLKTPLSPPLLRGEMFPPSYRFPPLAKGGNVPSFLSVPSP